MLIGLEIGAELVLVQDLGQNWYPNKYHSRPKVNFKHLRYPPMGAINVLWAGNSFSVSPDIAQNAIVWYQSPKPSDVKYDRLVFAASDPNDQVLSKLR